MGLSIFRLDWIMAIVLDWKIKARSGICHHTQKPFADEEHFVTCIFDDPQSDGFIRRDYSLAAWKEIEASIEPKPFSIWKSTFKAPRADGGKDPALKGHSVEAMLERMIEEGSPETENTRYILALMLERKKILVPKEVKKMENTTLLFYEHKETGSVYMVADPGLKLDEIGKIQEEVAALLAREQQRPDASGGEPALQEQGQPDGSEAKQEGQDSADAKNDPVA